MSQYYRDRGGPGAGGALYPGLPYGQPPGAFPGFPVLRYGRRPGLGADPQDPLAAVAGIWKDYGVFSVDFTGTINQLAAGTSNGRPSVQVFSQGSFKVDGDVHFEIAKTTYVATDPRVYVRYIDTTAGRYGHLDTLDLISVGGFVGPGTTLPIVGPAAVAGYSFIPYIWPRTHVVAAGGQFNVMAADYSAAINTVRIAFHGARIRQGRSPWDGFTGDRIPYTVVIPPDSVNPSIAASQTLNVSAPIDDQGDFMIHAITATRSGAAAVTLNDQRERSWFGSAQHLDNIAGNGSYPNRLPAPRYIPSGSSVYGTIQDLSAAANIVRITLHGERLLGWRAFR